MNSSRAFKLVHFSSTAWFIFCAVYLLITALLNAGRSWWFIVSLTGYSALAGFLLVSLYLFAVYRGVARSQKIEIEHVITTSDYYALFYDICPFLGGLAGLFAAVGSENVVDYLIVTASGTLLMTFLVWIVVDPAAGIIEMTLPSSVRHRKKRIAQTGLAKERAIHARQSLLNEAFAEEKLQRQQWTEALKPYAHKLGKLIENGCEDEFVRNEVVEIGVIAWQMGGVGCMRLLYEMVRKSQKQVSESQYYVDCISLWWNGIGNWRPARPEEIHR